MSESVPAKLDPPAKMAVRGLVAGGLTAVAIPIAGAAALVVLTLVAVVVTIAAAAVVGVATVSPIAIVLCPPIWATRPEFLRKLKEAGNAKKAAKAKDETETKAKARAKKVRATRARVAQWEAEREAYTKHDELFREAYETQRKLIREAQENARKGAQQARDVANEARRSRRGPHRQRETSYSARTSWQVSMDEDAFRNMFKDLFPGATPVDPERKKILKKLHNHVRFVNDKTGASAAERATHARLGNELIQKHNITQAELDALKP